MSISGIFPSDIDRFAHLEEDLALVIRNAQRLPHSPFSDSLNNFRLGQFDAVVSGDFDADLSALARNFGDRRVFCVVRDPSPEYYQDNYGGFPAFEIPVTDLEADLWDALIYKPQDDPTGSIFVSADILAIWGDSHRWAVWAERSWELAVVASDRPWEPSPASDIAWVSPQEALEWFIEPDFKRPLAPKVRDRFLATFGAH